MTKAAIATVEPSGNPDRLLELAIESNVDVDKLERIMALQERWQAQKAREAYYRDLADFQVACPPIEKSKIVKNKDGTERYRFAPLPKIISTVRQPLKECGFSFDWDTTQLDDGLLVTCYLNHIGGHQGKSSFPVPTFAGYGTNAAQDRGSAETFGKRYSLCDVIGIAPDEDDDAQAAVTPNQEALVYYLKLVRENIQSILQIKECIAADDVNGAAEVIAEYSRPTWTGLWRAPLHGSIWETAERDYMNKTEFKDTVHTIRKDSGWYDDAQNQV